MTKTEVCRKITNLTCDRRRTLVYRIIDEGSGPARYGASVEYPEGGQVTEVRRLTNDRRRIERTVDLLATNFVTPNMAERAAYEYLTE